MFAADGIWTEFSPRNCDGRRWLTNFSAILMFASAACRRGYCDTQAGHVIAAQLAQGEGIEAM
jgi:hypothetical protein